MQFTNGHDFNQKVQSDVEFVDDVIASLYYSVEHCIYIDIDIDIDIDICGFGIYSLHLVCYK